MSVYLNDQKANHDNELVAKTEKITSNSNELTDNCVRLVMYHQSIEDCERLLQESTGQKLEDIKENYFDQ